MSVPITPESYAMQIAMTMTPAQQNIFYGEYNQRAKNYNAALIWAITTGWWAGGHQFYLGRPWRGVIHIVLALLSVTIVPVFLTLYDIFNLHKTVDQINMNIANEVATKVRAMVPGE
jgi:TM2 domain-containing membrane protein YozV